MNESAATRTFLVAADFAAPVVAANGTEASVAALTARLVAGQEAAWREFHALYFERLLRYLLVVCRGNEDAAREGLQAALVKIVRHMRRFDREETMWSWLTVVARSCVIDCARRQSRYRALLERYAGISSNSPPAPVSASLPELLDECLDALPATERALLSAKYLDGESTAALAAGSRCTEKAIESRLARLRLRVKTQLLQRLRDEA